MHRRPCREQYDVHGQVSATASGEMSQTHQKMTLEEKDESTQVTYRTTAHQPLVKMSMSSHIQDQAAVQQLQVETPKFQNFRVDMSIDEFKVYLQHRHGHRLALWSSLETGGSHVETQSKEVESEAHAAMESDLQDRLT